MRTNPTPQRPLGDLSPKELQTELSCGNTKCWELIQTGQVVAYKVGCAVRVRRDSVEQFKQCNVIAPSGGKLTTPENLK